MYISNVINNNFTLFFLVVRFNIMETIWQLYYLLKILYEYLYGSEKVKFISFYCAHIILYYILIQVERNAKNYREC